MTESHLTKPQKGGIDISKENVNPTQLDFLSFCQEFGWGKLEVTIVNGNPVLSKELEHTHRHD